MICYCPMLPKPHAVSSGASSDESDKDSAMAVVLRHFCHSRDTLTLADDLSLIHPSLSSSFLSLRLITSSILYTPLCSQTNLTEAGRYIRWRQQQSTDYPHPLRRKRQRLSSLRPLVLFCRGRRVGSSVWQISGVIVSNGLITGDGMK